MSRLALLLLLSCPACGYVGIEALEDNLETDGSSELEQETEGETEDGVEMVDGALGGAEGSGGEATMGGGLDGAGGSRDGVGGSGSGGSGSGGASSGGAGTGGEGSGGSATGGNGAGGEFGTGGGTGDCFPFCPAESSVVWAHHDFEDGLPDGSYTTQGASMVRTGQLSHGGTWSLLLTQGQVGSEAEIAVNVGEVSGSWVYLRAWVYFPSYVVTGDLKLVGINTSDTPVLDVIARPEGILDGYVRPAEETITSGAGGYPFEQWFCLQVGALIDDVNGSLSVAVDGEIVMQVLAVDTKLTSPVTQVVYGMAATSNGQVGGQFWVDDVVVDDHAIGCEPLGDVGFTSPQPL